MNAANYMLDAYKSTKAMDMFGNKLTEEQRQNALWIYENLHNGFYYYPSKAMGLIFIGNITHFSEHEWGILEDLDEPLRINMETTYGFFENGMGGYVAIDLKNSSENTATLWFTNVISQTTILIFGTLLMNGP